jgi:hypothetical protein
MEDDVLLMQDDEMPVPFGVQEKTGELLPGLKIDALKAIGVDPKSVIDRSRPESHLAADESVQDPNDLGQAGWGVIFPADVSADVVTPLKPLLEWREQQARALYKEFPGYANRQSARDWLSRRGVGWSLVDPKKRCSALSVAGRRPEADPVRVPIPARQLVECWSTRLRHRR